MAKRVLPVVQTAGLTKVFTDFWRRPKVEAVKDLNLEIAPGEVFGLLGPNGSGKSTTIKMLLGLLYPTRGRISVFGKAPSDVSVKARIGFLPEESYLYRFLVASETLDYYGRLFQIPAKVRRERIDHLLDMVGLKHEAKRPVGEYSKGMARRIGLAQALINDPEFLILDEPTSGLDPLGMRQIKDVIRELANKGKTILLSSHLLADVEDVCDRVTILYGGQQRAAGDIGDLLRKRDVTQITVPALSEDTIQQLRELIQRLEQKDIIEVSHPRDKLEDFFIRIVAEAQEAKIKTSGARAGGEVPEFLSKATESELHDVVEELVSAGAAPQPQFIEDRQPLPIRDDGPETDVLDQLLGKEIEEAPEEETEEAPLPAPAAEPLEHRPASEADQSVIDSLLGGAHDEERRS